MARFFKQETKQPFTYPSIVERKSGPSYIPWIIGVGLVLITLFVVYLLLK